LANLLAAIARLDDHIRRQFVRVESPLILFAGRSVQFVAVGTLAMKNRSSLAAAQQLLAHTAPALVANFQHKQGSFADDSFVWVWWSSNCAELGMVSI
jgi:hypothetical protein